MTMQSLNYADVMATLPHPIERVWPVIAVFGGLERWVDGVGACTVLGDGVGAVRTVVRNGNSVRERLEAIDSAGHTLRYLILPPHSLPAAAVHGNIALRSVDVTATAMRWWSDAVDFTVAPAQLGKRIEGFYAASIEGLQRLLDTLARDAALTDRES